MALNIKYKECHKNEHKTLNVLNFKKGGNLLFEMFENVETFTMYFRVVSVFWAIYWCFEYLYEIKCHFLYIWTYLKMFGFVRTNRTIRKCWKFDNMLLDIFRSDWGLICSLSNRGAAVSYVLLQGNWFLIKKHICLA